jgi:hypothetical protein
MYDISLVPVKKGLSKNHYEEHTLTKDIYIVTCTPEERRYLVTTRQQLRKKALLGNGWPQQYQGRVFYGVGSQAINPRAMKSVRVNIWS